MTARLSDLMGLPFWPRCLSRDQAAAYVGLSAGTFDKAIRYGSYPGGIKIGGRTLWDRKALDEAVDRIHGTGTLDSEWKRAIAKINAD